MNQVLAGIYGTHGFEKVASAEGASISTLSDLALALVSEEVSDGADIEKVASVHEDVLGELTFYDLAGRSAAQAEFSEMEKMAAAGDWGPLEAFFEDQAESDEGPHSDAAAIKQAVLAELQRRHG